MPRAPGYAPGREAHDAAIAVVAGEFTGEKYIGDSAIASARSHAVGRCPALRSGRGKNDQAIQGRGFNAIICACSIAWRRTIATFTCKCRAESRSRFASRFNTSNRELKLKVKRIS